MLMQKDYARELHDQLLRYKELEHSLDDSSIESLSAFGYCAIDLSGLVISKFVEPEDIDDELREVYGIEDTRPATIIKIKEIDPDYNNENKLITVTDYIKDADGTFTNVNQNQSMLYDNGTTRINPLVNLRKLITELQANYIELEKNNADDQEIIDCENRLAEANREFFELFYQYNSFERAMGEYDDYSHKKLMTKLGSLVIYGLAN